MSKVSVVIDWLRYTLHWGHGVLTPNKKNFSAARLASACVIAGDGWKDCKARNGYTVAVECTTIENLTVSWNPGRIDMGVSVDMPGSVLQHVDAMEALTFALRQGAHVSRLDIAIDVPETWDAEEIKKAWKEKKAVCRARKGGLFDGDDGWTFYAGSRSSEKYLRIYDKQAQTSGDKPWTRIELECKGGFAQDISKAIWNEGYSIIPTVIRGFCDFPTLPRYQAATVQQGVYLAAPKAERHSNTRGWLLEIVAPALAKYIQANPDFINAWDNRIALLLGWDGRVGEVDIFDGKGDFEVK